MSEITRLLEIAATAAFDAGRVIMEIYQSGELHTEIKQDETPLTKADRLSHEIISKQLQQTGLPVLSEEGMNIDLSERKKWEYFWLVDPLDGTKEFINRNGEFTINIALVWKNTPIAGIIHSPYTDMLYMGSEEAGIFKMEKGKQINCTPLPKKLHLKDILNKEKIRVVASRSHTSNETIKFIEQLPNATLISMGSSLKFILLLENKADIYPRFGKTMEWDTAAAHAILKASNRGIYYTDLKSELVYNKPDLGNPFFIAF